MKGNEHIIAIRSALLVETRMGPGFSASSRSACRVNSCMRTWSARPPRPSVAMLCKAASSSKQSTEYAHVNQVIVLRNVMSQKSKSSV